MEIRKITNQGWLIILFMIGYLTAFWGAFEMAYQSGNHPIWSGTWGFPVPHHYVIGFLIVLVVYLYTLHRYDIE